MNSFETISFQAFLDEYMNKLNPTLSIHPALPMIFAGHSIIAYGQIIMKMTHKNSAPLHLYFDSPLSMKDISKKDKYIEEIFNFLDINKLGRIDAYEFLVPVQVFVDGKFDKFWDCLIDNFGVEMKEKISRDEFYYLIDTMFRGFAKLLVKQGDDPYNYKPRKYRLDYKDINTIVGDIFTNSFLDKIELKKNVAEKCPKLAAFLEYVHNVSSGFVKSKSKAVMEAQNKAEEDKKKSEAQ